MPWRSPGAWAPARSSTKRSPGSRSPTPASTTPITTRSAQLVYSLFTILLFYLGVVFGAAVTSTTEPELFAAAVDPELPDIVLWVGWVVFTIGFAPAFSVERLHFKWVLLVTLVTYTAQLAGTAVFAR